MRTVRLVFVCAFAGAVMTCSVASLQAAPLPTNVAAGPGKGDANDEFNIQLRETARFHAMQSLDAIAQMLHNPPKRG